MTEIPYPPELKLDAVWAYSLSAVGVVVGTVVMVWGLKFRRVLAAVAGVCIGFAVAPLVEAVAPVSAGIVRVVVVCVCAALAGVFTRVSWAVFAAVLGGAIAWITLVVMQADVDIPGRATGSFPLWCDTVVRCLFHRKLFPMMWQDHQASVIAVLAPAVLLPLGAAMVFSRMTTAIATSFVGAVPAVAGIVIAGSHTWPGMWPSDPIGVGVVGGSVVVLTLAGTFLQYARLAAINAHLEPQGGG